MTDAHGLTHVEMRGPLGPRLTPACVCGWYSADGSHQAYERHIRSVGEPLDVLTGFTPGPSPFGPT